MAVEGRATAQLDSSGYRYSVGGSSSRQLAQSFQVTDAWLCKKVVLYLEKPYDPNFPEHWNPNYPYPAYLQIRMDLNNLPEGDILASAAIYASEFEVNTPIWKEIILDKEVKLVPGGIYWLYLYIPDDPSLNNRFLTWYCCAGDTDPYLLGKGMENTDYTVWRSIFTSLTGDDFAFQVWGVRTKELPLKKEFLFKVYDEEGKFIGTIPDASFSSFTKKINGGLGELTFFLPRRFAHFEEGRIVRNGNGIAIHVKDKENPDKKIYSGWISSYRPFIRRGEQGVEVRCLGWLQRYALIPHTGTSETNLSVQYNSYDPSNIVRDVLDKVKERFPSLARITYTSSSIENTNSSVSYYFTTSSTLEVIEKARELAPQNWWFYVDADNILHFKPRGKEPDHLLVFGKHFSNIEVEKSIEDVRNTLSFWNGNAPDDSECLSLLFKNQSSIDRFGVMFERETDSRVTDIETARKWARAFLIANKDESFNVQVVILDSAEAEGGYDIESIEPGDIVRFLNLPPETSKTFEKDLQVVSITYEKFRATLELESLSAATSREVSKIKSELVEREYTEGQPDATIEYI